MLWTFCRPIIEDKTLSKKLKKQDSQLIIRINEVERTEFIALCEELDTSAAREVRRFIREFVAKHDNQHDKR